MGLNNVIRGGNLQSVLLRVVLPGQSGRLGINAERAREGYLARKIPAKCREASGGWLLRDFWRIILRYPEILAWETLWNDSLRETYQAFTVK